MCVKARNRPIWCEGGSGQVHLPTCWPAPLNSCDKIARAPPTIIIYLRSGRYQAARISVIHTNNARPNIYLASINYLWKFLAKNLLTSNNKESLSGSASEWIRAAQPTSGAQQRFCPAYFSNAHLEDFSFRASHSLLFGIRQIKLRRLLSLICIASWLFLVTKW
jgi:hypothetical protein